MNEVATVLYVARVEMQSHSPACTDLASFKMSKVTSLKLAGLHFATWTVG